MHYIVSIVISCTELKHDLLVLCVVFCKIVTHEHSPLLHLQVATIQLLYQDSGQPW